MDVELRENFPKLIMYATHQETVAPLLTAFEQEYITDPEPASSVFFMFYEHSKSCQVDENQLDQEREIRVKVSFNATPWDFDNLETLRYTEDQRD